MRLLGYRGLQCTPAMPEVPTFTEQGLEGCDAYTWSCLFMPARTPETDIARA